MNELVLASGSPRRRELLEQMGIPFTVKVSGIDEDSISESDPIHLVEELARMKGNAMDVQQGQVILSADTIVSFNEKVLTKPSNAYEASQMFQMLSGKSHWVYTGVTIRSLSKTLTFSVGTMVYFWELSEGDIQNYVLSGEWKDKAGGYGIQSKGALFVKEIAGDYYNVVGLPISRVVRELREFGIFPDNN